MIWRAEDIAFNLLDDLTSDPVVTVVIATPVGIVLAMAEPERHGRTLVLHRVHVQAEAGPNALGTWQSSAFG